MSMKVLTIGVGLAGSRFTESLSNKLTTLEEISIYVNICSEEKYLQLLLLLKKFVLVILLEELVKVEIWL